MREVWSLNRQRWVLDGCSLNILLCCIADFLHWLLQCALCYYQTAKARTLCVYIARRTDTLLFSTVIDLYTVAASIFQSTNDIRIQNAESNSPILASLEAIRPEVPISWQLFCITQCLSLHLYHTMRVSTFISHNVCLYIYITQCVSLHLYLQSVSLRHTNLDLCTCYRLLHHLTHLDPLLFVSPRNYSVTHGHPFTLTKPIIRLNFSKYSFFSLIVDPWNALPLVVVSSLTLPSFKYKLKYPPANDNS